MSDIEAELTSLGAEVEQHLSDLHQQISTLVPQLSNHLSELLPTAESFESLLACIDQLDSSLQPSLGPLREKIVTMSASMKRVELLTLKLMALMSTTDMAAKVTGFVPSDIVPSVNAEEEPFWAGFGTDGVKPKTGDPAFSHSRLRLLSKGYDGSYQLVMMHLLASLYRGNFSS